MSSKFRSMIRWLVVCLVVVGVADVGFAGQWQAGAGKVKITPQKLMWMAGYASRDHAAEGTLTDLWAKALVIQDDQGRRAVLITLDLIGIDRDVSLAACKALEAAYGLKRDEIAICTSHTHTGPVVARNLRAMHFELIGTEQQKLVEQYATFLEESIVAAVGQAIKNVAPCRLSWGSGTATFATNRRNNPEADVPKLREEGKLKGPFDHDVPVLAVRDDNDKLTAVAFGYACHCTVLPFYQWSGDYAGFAQIELEESHPDCVALFWAGCGADQNPLPRKTVELAKQYGHDLASAVDAVLNQKMEAVAGQLATSYREIDLPLDKLPTREEIEADAKSTDKYRASRARMFIAELDAGRPLPENYPYPVQSWQIGDDVQFVTLGGEVVVDYAVRLKAELRGKKTWVAGYTNDVMAYIPSRRVLIEGGYEGASAMIYYGLPTTWAPEVEELIVKEVHRQLGGGN